MRMVICKSAVAILDAVLEAIKQVLFLRSVPMPVVTSRGRKRKCSGSRKIRSFSTSSKRAKADRNKGTS